MTVKTLQKLVVPNQKDCIFVSPDYENWEYLLDENKRVLRKSGNTDIYRRQLLDIALNYTHQIGLAVPYRKKHKSIIVTGHQSVWHHCGVLAKNIMTDRFAQDVNGIAVHLVLDHDIGDTSMVLPEHSANNFLNFKSVELERPQQNIPLELRSLPSKEQVNNFIGSISKHSSSFCSSIWSQSSQNIIERIGSFKNVADIVTKLQALLNQALGLEMIYLPISLMSESECFTRFVCSVIFDAVKFAQIYNQAISNQIQNHNLNSAQTLKPLKIDFQQNLVELPFWLVCKTGQRFSLYVSIKGKKVSFGTASDIAGTLDPSGHAGKKQQLLEILKTCNCQIRPKAIGLTLFVRLYLADWFVHGIGGGFYEYITDYVIRNYYNIMKLNFGIATATMTLPPKINNQQLHMTDAQLKSQLRELKFNPERFINRSMLNKQSTKSLLKIKSKLIETANNLDIPAIIRKNALQKLAKINEELLTYTEYKHRKLLRKADLQEENRISREVINYRRFFFGLFPEEKLHNFTNIEQEKNENSTNCCSPS